MHFLIVDLPGFVVRGDILGSIRPKDLGEVADIPAIALCWEKILIRAQVSGQMARTSRTYLGGYCTLLPLIPIVKLPELPESGINQSSKRINEEEAINNLYLIPSATEVPPKKSDLVFLLSSITIDLSIIGSGVSTKVTRLTILSELVGDFELFRLE